MLTHNGTHCFGSGDKPGLDAVLGLCNKTTTTVTMTTTITVIKAVRPKLKSDQPPHGYKHVHPPPWARPGFGLVHTCSRPGSCSSKCPLGKLPGSTECSGPPFWGGESPLTRSPPARHAATAHLEVGDLWNTTYCCTELHTNRKWLRYLSQESRVMLTDLFVQLDKLMLLLACA